LGCFLMKTLHYYTTCINYIVIYQCVMFFEETLIILSMPQLYYSHKKTQQMSGFLLNIFSVYLRVFSANLCETYFFYKLSIALIQ